jgi:hypothetical protein
MSSKLFVLVLLALIAIVSSQSNSTQKPVHIEASTSTERSTSVGTLTSTEKSTPQEKSSSPHDEAIKKQWAAFKTKNCNIFLFIYI